MPRTRAGQDGFLSGALVELNHLRKKRAKPNSTQGLGIPHVWYADNFIFDSYFLDLDGSYLSPFGMRGK